MKKSFASTLDNVLLSDNVVVNFHALYKKDEEFRNELNRLLPEVEECMNQEQHNPWHKYNVMDHILHSVQEMNKKTRNMKPRNRKLLAYTMFLHDIGKPACHITRIKNGEEIDSFFGHNKKSAEVANRFLRDMQFSELDTNIIAKLVDKHDIFMFIEDRPTTNPYHKQLTPQVILDEYHDLDTVWNGRTMLRFLVMVGKCDNLAQNEKMTKGSLIMLGKFNSMIDNLDAYLQQEEQVSEN